MSTWDDVLAKDAPEHGWAEDCYLGGYESIPTGTPLDDALGGGLMPGLTVLGGVASTGKSAMACQAAASVADRGGRVLYLTLDDAWGNVVARCMSSWSIWAHERYGSGAFSWSYLPKLRKRWSSLDPRDRSRIAYDGHDAALDAARAWESGPGRNLAVIDSATSVSSIESTLRDLVGAGCAPDLVVVDYLQQYQTGDPELDRSEYSRVSDVAARLQRVSLWGGIPMLALSSLRKIPKGEDEPTLDWFRGSGVVGYSAWAACVLTKGERQGSDGWREAVINVVKNKGGRAGTKTSCKLWGAYCYSVVMD